MDIIAAYCVRDIIMLSQFPHILSPEPPHRSVGFTSTLIKQRPHYLCISHLRRVGNSEMVDSQICEGEAT